MTTLLGSDPGIDLIVIDLKVSPRGDHKINVNYDDFTLITRKDGQRSQALETCGDSDDLFVDSKRHRIYVTCGEGFIDVFSHDAKGYEHIGRLATSSGARTSLFVPELDRLYLAVRAPLFSAQAFVWVMRPE